MHYDVPVPEETILRTLAVFPYMTGIQLTKLLYSKGSYKEVLAKLKRLTDHGLVMRKPLPSQIRAGSVPYVYWLSTLGRHYLKDLGYDFSAWLPPSEMRLAKSSHLWHALDVNDFLISASLLTGYRSDITIADLRHDLVMQRTMNLPAKCDGFIDFRIREKEQQCIWLEWDRGTEKRVAFKEKIERLLNYVLTNYEQDFGTPSITIAFATPQTEHRGGEMRSWCEQVLTAMNIVHEADLFRFIALPEKYDEPEWLFLEPVWYAPFDNQPQALLVI